MKTTVEHVSKTKVKLTIVLGKEELDAAEQVALSKLARDMKVAGFRK
jgi:trigger factor